ncbi:Sm-like ribonucleoprotein [Neoconidiobolus thromboides FSU 785]|nr:Sm-like ribonucleoprotein [Neoconidiobolus thromboides FSU 785]
MVLPLGLLHSAEGHPAMVELKNGETFNGHLINCDSFMNLTLREVIQTSADGSRFWRLPECFLKGYNIKTIRVPDNVLEAARANMNKKKLNRDRTQTRGGGNQRGGRGRGN